MPSKDTADSELREQILTEFKQVRKLAPADYTENCTNVVMSIVQAHTNAEIAKVLDRLEAQWGETIDNTLGKPIRIKFVSVSAIQAERAKLKEVK